MLVLAGGGIAAADAGDPPYPYVPPMFIVGQAKVGVTLSPYGGIPNPSPFPDDVYPEWLVDGAVAGTEFTYTIVPSDLGKTIVFRITVVALGYQNGTSQSGATSPVVLGTQSFTPAITGAAAVGSTLKAASLATGATSSFQWRRNGSSISGARSSTYKPTSSDLGKKISVTVTAKRTGYANLTKTSAPTATVRRAFVSTKAPKITGTAKAGSTLTATTSAWSPAAAFKYQWYRDGVAISGATSATRKLSGADATHKITVKVTGSRSGYFTLTRTSAATATVAAGSITAGIPKIAGTAKAGRTLTLTPAVPSPSSAAKAYAWYRNGSVIAGATGTTYAVKNVDTGSKITAKVTYTLAGYATKTMTSAATATIARRAPSASGIGSYSPAGIEDTQYIAPGMYYTDTAVVECMWSRTNLVTNDYLERMQGPERWIVELQPGDYDFNTELCGDWIKYDGTGPQATSLTAHGMYFVGVDIQQGLWQLSATSAACFYAKSVPTTSPAQAHAWSTAVAAPGELVSLANSNLFRSYGDCGTWTRVGDIP